ncbi:MAG: endolytic transglycosylase MltG [Oscillospiraceae bacterium]|jgi:UPF0755 protein|nr:endolytic transglycosylase MltG [Oscillospiraceae bacterium]
MDDDKNGKTPDNSEIVGSDGEKYYSYNFGGESEKSPGAAAPAPAPAREPDAKRPRERARERDRDGDFNVSFDFDKEYADVPDDRPLRVRRERRTGCLGGVMLTVFIICVSLVAASLLWLAATDVLGFGGSEDVVQITVPEGFTIAGVADILADSGLIKYKPVFKLYAGFSKSEEIIVPGTYLLQMNYDYLALVRGMTPRGGKRATIDLTFPEGYTMAEIFKKLEESGVCSPDELWDAAANHDFEYGFLAELPKGDRHRLEGYLFPDTYTFYIGDSATRALGKMLVNFETKFKAEYYEKAEALGYSARDILIIASLIEREAGAASDRRKIASVIYNRLKNPDMPRLEIDATIYYAIAETGEAFSTGVESPYNTYRAEGLPPGPIANPGAASIAAALDPESTQYYYYALSMDEDRHHEFFRTFEEQQAFVHSDEYGG